MEINKLSENPKSSKKSDIIIITPDELQKLGLISEIISNPEAEQEKKSKSYGERNQTKPIENDKKIIKLKEKNKLCAKKQERTLITGTSFDRNYLNVEDNENKDDIHMVVDKSRSIIIHSNITFPKNCGIASTSSTKTCNYTNTVSYGKDVTNNNETSKTTKPFQAIIENDFTKILHNENKESDLISTINSQMINEPRQLFVNEDIPTSEIGTGEQRISVNQSIVSSDSTIMETTSAKLNVGYQIDAKNERIQKTGDTFLTEGTTTKYELPSELLQDKASIAIPKKRKYLMNLVVKETNTTRPLPKNEVDTNFSKEGEEKYSNELLTFPKKCQSSNSTTNNSTTDNSDVTMENSAVESIKSLSEDTCNSNFVSPKTSVHQLLEDASSVCQNVTDVKVPRKRGRPKKNFKESEETHNSETSDEGGRSNDLSKLNSCQPKHDFTVQELPEDATNICQNITDVKVSRKRGRRKKISKESEETHNSDFGALETSVQQLLEDAPNICQNVTDVKVPRKRGRPKKISNESIISVKDEENISTNGNDSTLSVMGCSSEVNDINETAADEGMITSTPLPKKRGRKRKSEQPVTEEQKNMILDESRSGRKRKKINYLELANELEEFKSSIISNKKQKVKDDNDTLKGMSASSQSEIAEDDVSLVEEKSTKDNISESKETSKYRRNGETAKMISSVFAAAFQNNVKCEVENASNITNDSSLSTEHPTNGPKRRGRKKKPAEIVIDQDNMVTCITCNTKINNDNWSVHNKEEHNNLARREGEQEIKLNDRFELLTLLQPILEENKEINCKKCKNSFENVDDFINHIENCKCVVSSTGSVTCAICKMEMEKTRWPIHKQRHHNNLAWRIGDQPLNLNDKNLVLNILNALYKAKKPLFCEKCGQSKKSVIGFLSHQAQCGEQLEDVKVKCQFCDKKVLPVSMQTHVKMVHEKPKEDIVKKSAKYFDIDSYARLSKRKAAKTALIVINKFSREAMVQEHSRYYLGQVNFSEEQFVDEYLRKELANNNTVRCKFDNCIYESDSVVNIMEHMNSCPIKPEQYYTCKKCLLITSTEEEMREHLKQTHDIEIVDEEYQAAENDEDDEDEMWEQYDMERKRMSLLETSKFEKDAAYKVKPTFMLNIGKNPNQLFTQAYNFTMAFCERHYSKENLFKKLHYLKSDWLLLDDSVMEQYLPRHSQSCDVARRRVKIYENVADDGYTLKQFGLFESECIEGTATIFCGGPVQAMSWLPTPYTKEECRQVLAVAPLKDFDEKFLVNQLYNDPCLIQFWDFGILKNNHPMNEPILMFCLAFEYGPVCFLEWCPSGCFDINFDEEGSTEMPRMGLLAVAGSDSVVYIYSIPHLNNKEMGPIYKVKPLLKLYLAFDEDYYLSKQKFYACRISWTKGSGHRQIAVGYTDGMVGLFDLESSNLLRNKDKDDCEVIVPYKSFQAHSHMITVIDWIHLGDGKRWLLTGSFDRYLTIWDLTNNFKVTSKRSIISDGLWLTNWLSYLTTADESSTSQNAASTLAPYRDYLYERVNLVYTKTSIKTVSSSSWLNSIIYSSSMGEIIGMFPPQLLYGLDHKKKFKHDSYLFGYTKLINKNLTYKQRLTEVEEDKSDASKIGEKKIKNEENLDEENICSNNKEPFTYEEAIENYGLLFCDTKMDSYSDFVEKDNKRTKFEELQEVSRANQYSLQAINKVVQNPNLQASLYYAAGYQAGFVRVTYMKFLEKDPQIK